VPPDARRGTDPLGTGRGRAQGAPERNRQARRDSPAAGAAGPAAGTRRRDPAPHLGAAAAIVSRGAQAGHRLLPAAHRGGAVSRLLLAVLLLGAPWSPALGQDPSARALDLERRGDYAGAAAAWRAQLAARPLDLAALLGLERALTPLGRLPEMIPPVQAAILSDPSSGVLGIAIRVYTAARQPDSARAAVLRWSQLEPTSEMPFQEWG